MSEDYGVKSIKTLEGIDAIRLRPGMYIGSIGADGIKHITLEIISNCVDEYLNGHCTECDIIIDKDNNVEIRDNGRGVPFGKAKDGSETLVNIYTKLHTGAKFDSNGKTGYNTSGGMNGVGAKATNALSKHFQVVSFRDGKHAVASFVRGKLIDYKEEKWAGKETGTWVKFLPDAEIFKETIELDYTSLRNQIQELAYLSPGLTFKFKYKDKPEEVITSQHGILDYIEDINKNKKKLTSIFYTENMEDRIGVKIAMLYNESYNDNYKLYTNSIPNSGGTHLTGFRTALTQSINEYARDNKLLKDKDSNITGEELKEGLSLVLSFIMPDPVFSGQTKDVLSSSEARTAVQRLVSKDLKVWLNSNPKDAKAIIDKALLARTAREKAKKAKEAVRQPKEKGLKAKMAISDKFFDCVNKDPSQRNLLLVEGKSAATSAVEARNVKTDCIYLLRGKIISPLKQSLEKLLANQEISDIIRVIGAGFGNNFDVNKMNFDKIVITSDQDSDGAAIELLLITFFYTYMRPLGEVGKLYRAMTPLYIIKQKDKEYFCYSEKELDDWKASHTGSYDLLRAKGLGELDAATLKEICFDNQRYKRLTVSDAEATVKLLDILEGPNVNPRKQYIYENATTLGFNFV